MRILVTGSRDWPEHADVIIIATLNGYELEYRRGGGFTIVVGCCPTGVDALVRGSYEHDVEVHRADWRTHGRAAGPIRNQAMVDSGADLCLAFVTKPLESSRGTADCVYRARRAGIPDYVIQKGTR